MASAKARYDAMGPDRWQFLQRARANAMLTIPSLMPLEGHDSKSHLIEPYQGLGSLGVTSLTSRLALALLPAGRPHLRMDVSNKIMFEMEGEIDPEVTRQLSKAEKLIQMKVEAVNWRATTLASVAQLIVSGSVIEHMLPDGSIRLFRLDQFVWRRDHRGRVVECVIRECFDKDALPKDVPVPEGLMVQNDSTGTMKTKQVELYTHIMYDNSDSEKPTYKVRREASTGAQVGDVQEYPEGECPYFFLRWASMPGEDYGRSKCEEVIADLRSLDGLEKSSLEIGALGAKNFVMIRPSATAAGLKNRIARIDNGDVVMGDPDSVDLKQFVSPGGFQIVDAQINRIAERVGRAFLLSAPGQRNAERVTATEIERDIQELESTLGGTFSVLSLEMLEARTKLLMVYMQRNKEFPETDKDTFNVTILTGLEALSRERDVQRGVQFANILQMFGEQGIDATKLDVVLNKIAVGLGFADAIRSADEIAQRQQQREQQAMVQQAIPNAVKAATGGGQSGG